ncbi:MAG: DUF1961 family protein [Verrucomicrobia bacterium]|nr:DUF1961 family protein [Verrucomicrobiota bacterium]
MNLSRFPAPCRLLLASSVLFAGLGAAPGAEGRSGVVLEGAAAAATRAVPGPRPGIEGIAAPAGGAPLVVSSPLASPLRDRGSLLFWLRTDRAYRSEARAEKFTEKIVEVAGTVTVSFVAERNALTLLAQWEGRREDVFERHIRVILPEFPGPAWHHVAVSWDGPAGRLNAFLDGTPYNLPDGPREPPLAVGTATALTLHLGRFALADVRVEAAPVSDKALREIVGKEAWGALDTLLGVKDYGPAPAERERGRLLYAAPLGSAADTRGWRLEGPGVVEYRDGWMGMKSQRPDGPEGHIVHWCPEEFPARFWAEWEFELLSEQGLCIVFFAARGQGGRDVFDPSLAPRNGVFKQYHSGDIDCYHISYFANTPGSARRVANLRKNAGFYLVANGPVGVAAAKPGEVHRAVLVKDGARLRLAVDGRTIIDHTDDGQRAGPVWAGGKIGFRQMQWTVGRYRNFRVHALAAP